MPCWSAWRLRFGNGSGSSGDLRHALFRGDLFGFLCCFGGGFGLGLGRIFDQERRDELIFDLRMLGQHLPALGG